ncbi:MAG TPA: carboxymuconolactone decarboxylase family protein [Myxococcota bacterium]|nr:carboxymuconolactone decarboxylase family protein [Myxococcota bacterium]
MSLIREIAWESCLLEPRRNPQFERRFRRETGRSGGPVSYFSGTSWLDDTAVAFSVHVGRHVSLEPQLAGLVGIVVSQDNSCRFCFAETRAFLRILGVPDRRIAQLEQDLLSEEFDSRERVALAFARRFSRANPPPDKRDIDGLRAAGFDELQILELASVAGLYVFFNRVTTLFALPPYAIERFPDRWHVRLLRPLIARRLVRSVRGARIERLEPGEGEGIFAPVVLGLDGLPFARSLRRTLDGMWTTGALSQRTKGLVIAIVARALGCARTEREAAELLVADGLHAREVESALAHLASPALDAKQRTALSFARETVWYEPARIQRRGREAMQSLSRDEFIELVAVASIANMVCRLGAIVCAA